MRYLLKKTVFHGDKIIRYPLFTIGILVFLFIYFAIGNAHFQSTNRDILNGIAGVQKKQDETLQAIKDITIDSRLTAEEQTKIILCMLQVPISERTPDVERNCRKEVVPTMPTPSSLDNSSSTDRPPAAAQQPSNDNDSRSNPPEPSPPVRVLGVPVCLPFSDICVR